MRAHILIIFFSVIIQPALAQQLPHLSQYMFNDYFINPAVTGTKETKPAMVTARNQWSGLNDAPVTQTFSLHGSWFKEMGIGGIIINDKTGPVRQTGIQISYAYHLYWRRYTYLSLGLAGMLYQHVLDKDAIVLDEPDDKALLEGREKVTVPEASFGLYLYGRKYYAGLSAPQLFESKMDYNKADNMQLNRLVRHYYISAGYNFEVNENFKIEPSFLIKAVESAPIQADINAKFMLINTAWVGISYRSNESVVVLLGAKQKSLSLGYSYDVTLTNIRKYSSGSHEVFAAYDLPEQKLGRKEKKAIID